MHNLDIENYNDGMPILTENTTSKYLVVEA